LRTAARTDPSLRNYRTRLVPQVLAAKWPAGKDCWTGACDSAIVWRSGPFASRLGGGADRSGGGAGCGAGAPATKAGSPEPGTPRRRCRAERGKRPDHPRRSRAICPLGDLPVPRCLTWSLNSQSFARTRFELVTRSTQKPAFLPFAQNVCEAKELEGLQCRPLGSSPSPDA